MFFPIDSESSLGDLNPNNNLDLYESNSLNSLEEGMNYTLNGSNDIQYSSLTASNNQAPISNHLTLFQNSIEEIQSDSAQNVDSISINDNQRIQMIDSFFDNTENATTREKTTHKKRGRRKKGSTLKGGHTRNYPGNILRKTMTAFANSKYPDLNKRCKKYERNLRLKKINVTKQFGYNVDNKRFIKLKFYKILRYKNKHNQKVIDKMTKKYKDRIFIFIINCTFEHLYRKYIENKKNIYFDDKNNYSNCLETLDEIANKKEELNEFDEDWTKEKFLEASKQFLDEVNGNGKLRNRSRRIPNKVSCEYEVVEEIENFFRSQEPYIY